MSITMHFSYKGKNGNARRFAEEIESAGTANTIRRKTGNERHDYFVSLMDPETVLLIDQWATLYDLNKYLSSPLMQKVAALREKYELEMQVERFVSESEAKASLAAGEKTAGQTSLKAGDRSAKKGGEPSIQKKKPHVLVVDDMPVNQKIMMAMLEPLGVTSDFAASGEACLDMCEKTHYDLIFMDQNMPGGAYGTEVVPVLKERISEKQEHIPIVCFTSHDTPKSLITYKEAGFDAVLGKPAHPVRVREILIELLGAKFDLE